MSAANCDRRGATGKNSFSHCPSYYWPKRDLAADLCERFGECDWPSAHDLLRRLEIESPSLWRAGALVGLQSRRRS